MTINVDSGKIDKEYELNYVSDNDSLQHKNKDVYNEILLDKICEWIEDNVDERYIRFTLDGCRDPEIEYYRIIEDLRKHFE